ncbi:MAG: hypothetical protein ACK5LT_00415 [Lachnospirales bacterium]
MEKIAIQILTIIFIVITSLSTYASEEQPSESFIRSAIKKIYNKYEYL